jgi:two-component system, NarL family, nitrate/nitrite response regulator NarL
MHADAGVDPGLGEARTSVFIVTPIRLYRDGIAHFLRSSGRVVVLGTAEESATTIRLATELVPDVILLDMALEDSRETARRLTAAVPGAAIVALAVPESEGHVVGCAEAGICGYVSREGSLDELLATVTRTTNGEALCSPRIAASLFRRVAALSRAEHPPEPGPEGPSRLTAREAEVVALIDHGLSNKQIARELCIEVPTVKNHVHSILEKLGASSRGEAAARARHAPANGR